ncbi:P-loop containing nucleoside triphosphate hydrolase protein [Xylaria arbuscula]|nr:P-loop containing nucleoside triphosphate hydrolase protein [Xylaria arbuscula]
MPPPQPGPPATNGQPPVPISITICGDGGCGKSSITLRLVRSQWTSEYDPTIEDSYSITRRIDGTTYHMSLTDTAGQEEYRGMWASSNLGADAFLLVYDITSADSLDALGYFTELIDMEAETRLDNAARARRAGLGINTSSGSSGYDRGGGGRMVPPVKIVAGNKCDLQESRQVSAAQGLEWARRRGCGFMETSARLEVNIEETFALIVRRVVEARRRAEMGVLSSGAPGVSGGGALGGGLGHAREEELEESLARNRRGVTKPLTPLPSNEGEDGQQDEKRGVGVRGPRFDGSFGRSGFWRSLRCW